MWCGVLLRLILQNVVKFVSLLADFKLCSRFLCCYVAEELLEFLEPNFISLVLPAISCKYEFCNWLFYLRK